MKTSFKAVIPAFMLVLFLAISGLAQQPTATPAQGQSPYQKSVESFLRHYYALGTDVSITVGSAKEVGTSGLQEVPVEVKTPEGTQTVNMFLSKDGRYLVRGEVSDLTSDPLADARAKISIANSPVLGDPNAPITLVEYSDFQCPVCRSLHDTLRGLLPNYPQVKVVFKDFPLETLHPWARTAALAARCAYTQDNKAFWKMYDLIYDNQDLISAANAYDKMLEFAGQAGLNEAAFKACMTSPPAAQAIEASVANGNLLEVHSTPTVFVNGRRIVGADPHGIQQYIDYEIVQLKTGNQKAK